MDALLESLKRGGGAVNGALDSDGRATAADSDAPPPPAATSTCDGAIDGRTRARIASRIANALSAGLRPPSPVRGDPLGTAAMLLAALREQVRQTALDIEREMHSASLSVGTGAAGGGRCVRSLLSPVIFLVVFVGKKKPNEHFFFFFFFFFFLQEYL
jgi:hypothetical protein